MTTLSTQLLQSFENRVTISGLASKSDVELKSFKNRKDGSEYRAYTGRVSIRTSENEVHTVQVFTREFKADGTENKLFKSMETLFDKLVTLEDVAQWEGSEEEAPQATKLFCFANLDLNEYFREGQLNSALQPRAITLSSAKADKYEPHASFDLDAIVIKVTDEFKLGEETGRKILHVMHPTYNGSLPFELVVEEGEGAEYVEENFEVGSTVNVYGDIINFSKKIEDGGSSKGGWGVAKAKPKWENKRELLLSGGTVMDEENPKTLEIEQIKHLQALRNQHLASLEERSQGGGEQEAPKKKAGFSSEKKSPVDKKEALTGAPAKKPKADLGSLF